MAPVDASTQLPPVIPLLPDTVTVPAGAEAVPVGSVSVTVTVARLVWPTRTVAGESVSAVVVWRPATVRLNDWVAD